MALLSNDFRAAPVRVRGLATLASFFRRLGAARNAAIAYDELSAMTDAQLRARGLSRADIGRYIAATHLDV